MDREGAQDVSPPATEAPPTPNNSVSSDQSATTTLPPGSATTHPDNQGLHEPLMRSHQIHDNAPHEEKQAAAMTHGSTGTTLRDVRDNFMGLVERMEKAVGILPNDHDAAHDRAPSGTTPEAGSEAGSEAAASGLPPHDPAQAARERQQQEQHQTAAAAADGSLLARELPSLVSIRDSAREYVDTLRHSMQQPDQAAAELAGRIMGKSGYAHPPHPTPLHGTSHCHGQKRQQHTNSGSSPRQQHTLFGRTSAGSGSGSPQQSYSSSFLSRLSGRFSPGGGGGSSGSRELSEAYSQWGGAGDFRAAAGQAPNSFRQAVTHTPEAAAELAGRIIGKSNYQHTQRHTQPHQQPQPHPQLLPTLRQPARGAPLHAFAAAVTLPPSRRGAAGGGGWGCAHHRSGLLHW